MLAMLAACCILMAALSPFLQSAGPAKDPWLGTWSLNFAKSTPDPEARYKRATTTIDPWEDGLQVVYDLVGTRGGLTHMEWKGRFDGKDYAVQGVDYVLTNAYSRTDERSYQIVSKLDGVVTSTAKVVVSPDGKTLTTSTTGKDGRGNTVTTTTVYERK
jgi:hypothetical protein